MIVWDGDHTCYRWTNPSTGHIVLTVDLAAIITIIRRAGFRPTLTTTLLGWKVGS